MYQNTKSATTAGLLGIFLGAFGAHNWYLGEKGKGIAHVCMMSGGLLIQILMTVILPNVLSYSALATIAWLILILTPVSLIAMSASGIWGLVEGIIILTQGDAGLARKGYAVAESVTPQPGYGQPMNQPMNGGYNQPYYGPQPMPGQPMPGQPMNQGYGPQGIPGQPMPNQMPSQPAQPNQPMPGQPNDMNGGIYGH